MGIEKFPTSQPELEPQPQERKEEKPLTPEAKPVKVKKPLTAEEEKAREKEYIEGLPSNIKDVADKEKSWGDRFRGHTREIAVALSLLTFGCGLASAAPKPESLISKTEVQQVETKKEKVVETKKEKEKIKAEVKVKDVLKERTAKEHKKQKEKVSITFESAEVIEAMNEQGITLGSGKLIFEYSQSAKDMRFDVESNGVVTNNVILKASRDKEGKSVLTAIAENSDGSKDIATIKGGDIISLINVGGR